MILRAGAAIRPYLAGLLTADTAAAIDAELARILNSGSPVEDAEPQVLDVLRRHTATHDWAAAFMVERLPPDLVAPVRREASYQRPPGDETPGSPPRYACPESDFEWYRRHVGQGVPRCPTHGVELALAEEG